MSVNTRSVLLTVLYLLNVGVVVTVLGAAYYISQGLFGDLYACNEKALGEVEHVYQVVEQKEWSMQLCLVDLNYTAGPASDGDEQSFYALQVTIPCERIVEDETNATTTDLCYNRYHPEFFASVSYAGPEAAATTYTHEDAVRDLHFGVRAALWTALLGFFASWLHTNLDATESRLILLQERSLQAWKHARAQVGAARRNWSLRCLVTRGQREDDGDEQRSDVRESEMQHITAADRV